MKKGPATIASTMRPSCVTEEHFTFELHRNLGLPQVHRLLTDTDRTFLIRWIKPLQCISRQWNRAELERLTDIELDIAANQICHAAADYCQDRGMDEVLLNSINKSSDQL